MTFIVILAYFFSNKKGKSVTGFRHMQDRLFETWVALRHIQRNT
jgi:hypothetical protein